MARSCSSNTCSARGVTRAAPAPAPSTRTPPRRPAARAHLARRQPLREALGAIRLHDRARLAARHVPRRAVRQRCRPSPRQGTRRHFAARRRQQPLHDERSLPVGDDGDCHLRVSDRMATGVGAWVPAAVSGPSEGTRGRRKSANRSRRSCDRLVRRGRGGRRRRASERTSNAGGAAAADCRPSGGQFG